MLKAKIILGVVSVVLVIAAIIISFKSGKNDTEELSILLAFLALLYPLLKAFENGIEINHDKKKIRQVQIIKGGSLEALKIEVNKELKNNLKGKTIVSIEISNNKALIMFY
ncbi:hypothetical protein QUF81_00170 [Peribacillus simplex]|uniref:hypothetical protein n=1 Tax=Peribacillus simplex TaxID=1478 RepID=UPI0025A1D2A6|nr:hypothetical protein [Peribacillus simplex]MDM5291717.1 hypothetical protein [Peribacillus simplex]